MVTVCAWCQKYMGSKEPLHNPAVSHGICNDCVERDSSTTRRCWSSAATASRPSPCCSRCCAARPRSRSWWIAGPTSGAAATAGNGHGRPVAYVADRRADGSPAGAVVLPRLTRGRQRAASLPNTRAKTASTWVR